MFCINQLLFLLLFYVFQLAEKYLSELQLKTLKLALSLHIFSPKIEMFGQIASENGLPESRCPSAIHFNDELFCKLENFVQYFKKKGKFHILVFKFHSFIVIILFFEIMIFIGFFISKALKHSLSTRSIKFYIIT